MRSSYHPAFQGVVNYSVRELPKDPDSAVALTLGYMGELARADSDSREVRAAVQPLVSRNRLDTIDNIYWWIKRRVHFTRDSDLAAPLGLVDVVPVEVLVRPVDLLRMPEGREDCDGFTMLAASMFEAVGVPWRFVTIGADADKPDQFTHVYLEVQPTPYATIWASSHPGRYLCGL